MWYSFTITHAMRFELAMDFVAIGMSFRQVSKAIEHAKIRTSAAHLTGVNDFIVIQYVRVLVNTSLQHMADQLGLGDIAGWQRQHASRLVFLRRSPARLLRPEAV